MASQYAWVRSFKQGAELSFKLFFVPLFQFMDVEDKQEDGKKSQANHCKDGKDIVEGHGSQVFLPVNCLQVEEGTYGEVQITLDEESDYTIPI